MNMSKERIYKCIEQTREHGVIVARREFPGDSIVWSTDILSSLIQLKVEWAEDRGFIYP